MLLVAKFMRKENKIKFYLPEQSSPRRASRSQSCAQRRTIPAFSMNYSEHNDNYLVTQTHCDHCVQRPKHLSCSSLGQAQQIAFIQHSRRRVGPDALLHYVDVRIPSLVADTESVVWCPVTIGRDLADSFARRQLSCCRAPGSPASSRSPRRCRNTFKSAEMRSSPSESSPRRSKSQPASSSPTSPHSSERSNNQDEEEEDNPEPLQLHTKMPIWDDVVESLVLNFKDRTVQSSPMNFMLCAADEGQRLVMQHAKLSANTYCLDFRHPLSTTQAFSIALSGLWWD